MDDEYFSVTICVFCVGFYFAKLSRAAAVNTMNTRRTELVSLSIIYARNDMIVDRQNIAASLLFVCDRWGLYDLLWFLIRLWVLKLCEIYR